MASKKPVSKARHSSVSLSPQLGRRIDALFFAREERLAKEREVESLKQVESKLKDELLELLAAAKLTKAAGELATVSVNPKQAPRVLPDERGWPKLYAYVKKTGAFELFQKRLNDSAVLERVENGEKVPGIELVPIVKLNIARKAQS